jgi:chaperonin GroEL (HSP60 family)
LYDAVVAGGNDIPELRTHVEMECSQTLYQTCCDVIEKSEKVIGYHNAKHIIIRSNEVGGEVFITSSSSHFLRETKSKYSDPLSKIFFEILCQNSSHGDMGWLCILFAAKLISGGVESEISTHSLMKGYALAFRLAVRELRTLRMHIRWSNHSSILCVVRSLIMTRTSVAMNEAAVSHVSVCILDAFLSSLTEFGDSFAPTVLFCEWPGLSVANTRHLPHSLCLQIPLPRLFAREQGEVRGVRVAAFESSLEMSPLQGVTVEIDPHSSDAPGTVKTAEYAALRRMRDVFLRSGVGLVCCQRRIHPYLQRLLAGAGVVCIPRLSIRYIQSLLAISGAKQLGAFDLSLLGMSDEDSSLPGALDPLSLGYLDCLSVQFMLQGTPVLVASSPWAGEDEEAALARMDAVLTPSVAAVVRARSTPISTLRVCGRTSEQCRELRGGCEQAVRVLSQLMQAEDLRPRVLPGAGCWQAYLAHAIRTGIEREQLCSERDVNRAAELFCSALGSCANIVGGNTRQRQDSAGSSLSGFEFPDTLNGQHQIRFRSPSGCVVEATHGREDINTEEDEGEVIQADVLDAYGACVGALSLAVEAALCVLDVDCIMTQTTEE